MHVSTSTNGIRDLKFYKMAFVAVETLNSEKILCFAVCVDDNTCNNKFYIHSSLLLRFLFFVRKISLCKFLFTNFSLYLGKDTYYLATKETSKGVVQYATEISTSNASGKRNLSLLYGLFLICKSAYG